MAVWLAGACGHADVRMECLLGLMISMAVVIVLSWIKYRGCVVYFFLSNLELLASHF